MKHNLTPEIYHADKEFISSSYLKKLNKCEYSALYEPNEDKECFKEGRLFEVLVSGTDEEKAKFFDENKDMLASTGKNKGSLKSNFTVVVNSANFLRIQKFLTDIIDNCEKQTILVGEINGVKVKAMYDLINRETGDIFDLKCMANFTDKYMPQTEQYASWWECYGYHIQMWLYREIARQNGIKEGRTGLIACSKQAVPEIKAITFSDGMLGYAEGITRSLIDRHIELLNGAEPIRCEACEFCKKTAVINEFEIV